MLEWTRMSYLSPNAAKRFPVSSACSRPGTRHTHTGWSGRLLGGQAGSGKAVPAERGRGPSGVRILSLSLLPLRLYCECLMRRMLRVAFGLPLSCSVLGSSVAVSFFLPLISEEGSLLEEVRTERSWD